jgi:hypothetical protein
MKIEYAAPVADITYFDIRVLNDDQGLSGGPVQLPEHNWGED